MTRRVRVAALADLPDGRGVRVEFDRYRIALFRIGGEVHAVADRCSHAEASLAEGELYGRAVECPRHGAEFDLVTGAALSLPATKAVEVYRADVSDGAVFLDLEAP